MAKPANTAVSEALGVLLLGVGVLLLLALVSYDPADVPSWLFFNTVVPSNEKISNFIGIVGVIGAGLMYFFLGAAAYLLAVTLLGFGAAKMCFPKVRMADRTGWAALFLICGASLLSLQSWFLQDWGRTFRIEGPGGWLGHWIGTKAFGNALGSVGSVIVLGVLYFVSLILLTGFHPIRFVKACIRHVADFFAARRERRRARLDEQRLFEENQRKLDREALRLEKKTRKKTAKPSPEPEPEPEPEPPANLPEPKIIDATAPKPKPTLAELEARKKANQPKPAPALQAIHLENYTLPELDLLDAADADGHTPTDPAELKSTQEVILDTLAQFGIQASPGDITKGPTITRYELYPAKGVRVDRITSLERDIARATRAERINILAPIPGKDTVGIEIANAKKVKVTLRELFESDAWVNTKAKLPLALGKDVYGNVIIADLAQMPHCLVAGTTGSGKSVCINAIIASLLYRFTPEQLRFIMIDPKVVEMQLYNTLPHLVTPVVTEPKKVLLALRWVVDEMELRYRIIAKCGVRNIAAFNARPKPKSQAELDAEREKAGEENPGDKQPIEQEGQVEIDTTPESDYENHPDAPDLEPDEAVNEPPRKIKVPRDADDLVIPDFMPYIVVIIDELADLMQTAPADVESAIARIAQKARAAGIHLIVATQTPRADVVTGIIKANIPSRIAFQVASKIDSRVILDENGAEKLLGQGDMLYLPPGTSKLIRSQGVLVTDEEIRRVVEFVSASAEPQFEPAIHAKLSTDAAPEEEISEADEELVAKCLDIIKQEGRASTSMLQRRLRLGYTRAARVVDILEQRGILGPPDGAKQREILIDLNSLP